MKQVVITLLVAGVAYTSAQGGPHRPYCQTENGFDYPGNDIANVSASDSNPCCSACDTHQGCKAWTWSNYNGGTCWLKSKRGDIVVNKDTKSAMLFNGYQPVCQVRQDLDFEGNDLARVDGKTANDCCEACRNQLGCRAYSWNNYMGGSCWLKSKRDKVVYKAGVQSAEAYPSSYEPLCVPRENVDFVGNNIGNASSPNPDACCAICGGRPYCRAYSWNNYNGGTCWLKNVVGMAVAKQGVQSGQMSDNPSSVCVTESGFDYKGADIANEPSTDAGLCCAICYEHAGCKAYTWSNYQGGTCWLKGDGYTRVASAGTVSGKATPY